MKRYAVITGAYRGLGFETLKLLLADGYSVFLAARTLAKAREGAKKLASNAGEVLPLELDVESSPSIERAAVTVNELTPALHLLINNAGFMSKEEWNAPPEKMTSDLLWKSLDVNLVGVLEVTKAFLPLLEKGQPSRIVNVSSTGGSIEQIPGMLFAPAYQISKAALNALTRELSVSLKSKGISVNSVCPGWCRTEMGGANAPRSPEDGARSIYWAAVKADQGVTGGFFRDGEPVAW